MGACTSLVPREEKKHEQASEFVKAAQMGEVDQILLMLEHGQSIEVADVSAWCVGVWVFDKTPGCDRNSD